MEKTVGKNPSTAKLPESLVVAATNKLTRPFTILYISFQIEKGKKKKINKSG